MIESYNVYYLIRELKKCNEHFDSFDFEEKIKYGIDKIKRELYEKRVKNNEKIVKGKSFEEYQKLWANEVADDALEAERIGQIEGMSCTGTFLEKYMTLLPIDDSQIMGLSYSEIYKMCETVLKLSNSVNRKKFIGKFRYECLKNICLMLVDLKEKFEIPIRANYFTERNYNDFIRIHKLQCEKNEKYMDKISIVENLMRFPFAIDQYALAIKYCGDCDKQLEQYAKGFFVDIIPIKIKQLEQFIADNVQIKMNEENQVKGAYEKINSYKNFIGLDYKTSIENELKDKLEEFDILYRTVNGKTYETREEADEVRSRSFEGKEYESKEQAELVRKEVGDIRNGGNVEDIVEKYRNYQTLSKQEWETKEARVELEKLKAAIDDNYKQMVTKAGQILESEKKFKQKGIICGIGTVVLLIVDISLGIIAAIISAVIIFMAYKQVQDCKAANTKVMEMNIEYAKYGEKEKIIDQGSDENNGMTNQKPSEPNETCPSCGLPIDKTMKFCPKCGKKLEV